MKYTRQEYVQFLCTELEAQEKNYEQLVKTKATVLKNNGEVFVGMFQRINEAGFAVFKVRNSENMPRKNSFWSAVYLNGEMGKYKNWGDLSWIKLREEYQRDFSDCLCAWISKSEDPAFCLVGIKSLTVNFAGLLEQGKTIIAFGPKDPPLQYLLNLIQIVKDELDNETKAILDFSVTSNQWDPTKIEYKEDLVSILLSNLLYDKCVVVQGPPGTGKTYRMAQLAAKLLEENKSVLATALTNQALMEMAKKEDLEQFLTKGRISKTSLTIDESRELPKLQAVNDNRCNSSQGDLTLATFYISSGWAIEAERYPFDYVIMDEASQAFLPMIAATMKLGKKVILIGDQNQLPPIVLTNEDVITRFQWASIVKGFDTICHNFTYKSYMLRDTFRMTQRGAECTGIFYNNELRSVSDTQVVPSKLSQLVKKGGPVFVGLDLKIGDQTPNNAFHCIFDYVSKIIAENPKAEIAVLSKFRETIRQLQKYFVINWSITKELPDNILIETVDRVQGLTVDYCIFLIPKASLLYSLENELFNVATSRARYNTIIVADNNILRENISEEVRKYILKSQEYKFASFEPKIISVGNVSINVVGQIDLDNKDYKKNGLVEDKEYIYIIDTNVFVSCPDIISRIGNKNKIVIPAKVLEELDKLKLKADLDKKKINEAAKNINKAFVNRFSQMEEADLSLLPEGFDIQNPDCMILSVALKYKQSNPILLTSDNILQTRASGLGITAISLRDYLKR